MKLPDSLEELQGRAFPLGHHLKVSLRLTRPSCSLPELSSRSASCFCGDARILGQGLSFSQRNTFRCARYAATCTRLTLTKRYE